MRRGNHRKRPLTLDIKSSSISPESKRCEPDTSNSTINRTLSPRPSTLSPEPSTLELELPTPVTAKAKEATYPCEHDRKTSYPHLRAPLLRYQRRLRLVRDSSGVNAQLPSSVFHHQLERARGIPLQLDALREVAGVSACGGRVAQGWELDLSEYRQSQTVKTGGPL